jgi:NADPH:quinone reductase-like Zn-dependent oxidoreductase
MKAILCTQYGPPDVLKIGEVPVPVVTDDGILVKIYATAVNSGDVRVRALAVEGAMKWMMRLVLGFTKPRKPILGTVYAGVVEQVGARVSHVQVGDRVFGMTGFAFGTHAEYCLVSSKGNLLAMPRNASFEEAAALIFGGQTAIYFLEKAKIPQKTAPKVLIIGATGSVGVAAIQLCMHYGAAVTAVCSSAGRELMNELGVKNVIYYDQEEFSQYPERFDLVFDAVGKTTKKQCAGLLTAGGLFKTVGGLDYASESVAQLALLKELHESGQMKAVIDRIYPMDEAVEAHRYVDTGRKKGNVVLRISG